MILRFQNNSNNDQRFYFKLLTRINDFKKLNKDQNINSTKVNFPHQIADHKFHFYFRVLSRFELLQESDEFVKHSIDHLLGLAIPEDSIQLKIRSLESSSHIFRNQYLFILSKLKQKEQAVKLARTEACLNAQAMKKFVEKKKAAEYIAEIQYYKHQIEMLSDGSSVL